MQSSWCHSLEGIHGHYTRRAEGKIHSVLFSVYWLHLRSLQAVRIQIAMTGAKITIVIVIIVVELSQSWSRQSSYVIKTNHETSLYSSRYQYHDHDQHCDHDHDHHRQNDNNHRRPLTAVKQMIWSRVAQVAQPYH